MKIAYCLNSISHVGGIGIVTVVKANALAEAKGNEIYIIVTDRSDRNDMPVSLSPKVRVIDLKIGYYADDWKSRWHVLKGIFIKRRLHKKRLAAVLHAVKPDIVVSVGQSEKYLLAHIPGNWVKIREFHYCKNYRIQLSETWMSKIAASAINKYEDARTLYRYDHIVTLTQEDKQLNWKRQSRVSVIPNPQTLLHSRVSSLDAPRIIAAGRLTAQKNFSSLIRAFRRVADCHPDWTLEIYGEGSEREQLQHLIEKLSLEKNVQLCGASPHIQEKMAEASFLAVSSQFEGFGLVITEAMSCGLPVVSYDCPCGPKDIIDDGADGFLVPTGDEQKLAEKICYLIEHPDERAEMGAAALKKAGNYRLEKIVPMWMNLFERLLAEKRNSYRASR